MSTAVPDPRFRDQLAGWLFDFSMKARGVQARWADPSIGIDSDREELLSDTTLRAAWRSEADRLIEDVIAAEVEARVQVAVGQRAAEVVEPGLSVESNGRRLAWFTDDELAAELNRRAAVLAQPVPEATPCWCISCEHLTVRARTEAGDPLAMFARRFIVCPDCGNKRCPKATQHDLACTGSNEPGQPGSAYAQTVPPPASVEELRARILAHRAPALDAEAGQ